MAANDELFLRTILAPDVRWKQAGEEQVVGFDTFFDALQLLISPSDVAELSIDLVSTHGKAGAVSGVRTHHDGSSCDYCTVIEFSSGGAKKVRKLIHFETWSR